MIGNVYIYKLLKVKVKRRFENIYLFDKRKDKHIMDQNTHKYNQARSRSKSAYVDNVKSISMCASIVKIHVPYKHL